MKLAVMTWHHYHNYGTALQAAAMQAVLRDMGHEPQLIQYRPCGYFRTLPDYSIPEFGRRIRIKLMRTSKPEPCGLKSELRDRAFDSFLERNIKFTEPCRTLSDLELLNDKFDAFICGSDQVWSPLAYDPHYYLNFVHDNAKKIAYAPSMGAKEIRDRYIKADISHLLDGFGALSAREDSGARLICGLTGRHVEVVADPTFLLDAERWEKICCADEDRTARYLLVYMLGNSDEQWAAIEKTASSRGLALRIIPVFEQDTKRSGCVTEPVGPEEFVKLFRNAEYVCTDSFHGMAFSLIFHRNFTAFARFGKNDPKSQNSRMEHLLRLTGMEGRLFSGRNAVEIASAETDFERAEAALNILRGTSLEYIRSSLSHVIPPEKQSANIKARSSLCCGCGACAAVCPTSAIKMEMSDNGFLTAKLDSEICVECGRCTRVCPFGTENMNCAAEDAQLYSFKNPDGNVLLNSTSGGAAYSIARFLVRRGYKIVGCMFNAEKQRAEHILISDEGELYKVQGSKYIQSDFSDVIKKIRAEDKSIALVVFGTPCQIAAARRVLKEWSNVIFVDLVCHGVPSYHLYEKYGDFIHRTSGVDNKRMQMVFRYKPKSWRDIYLYASDGEKSYCCSKMSDPFFRMFEAGNCYMESCYECRWRSDSEADIRLGDYWGPRFEEDKTGVSMIVCFTEKGRRAAMDAASACGAIAESQPIEDYLKYQQRNNIPKPVFYDTLMRELKSKDKKLESFVDRYTVPLESRSLSSGEYLKYVFKMLTYKEPKNDT